MAAPTLLVVFISIVFTFATLTDALTKCEKISACSCQSDNGLIDLKVLDGTASQPQLKTTDVLSGYDYYYNPCTPFTAHMCTGVAGCQFSSMYVFGYAIGDHNSATFDVQSGDVTIKMHSGDQYNLRKMEVKLICDKRATSPTFTFVQEYPTSTYKFSLTSEHACPYNQTPATTEAPTTTRTTELIKPSTIPTPTPNEYTYWFITVMVLSGVIAFMILCATIIVITKICLRHCSGNVKSYNSTQGQTDTSKFNRLNEPRSMDRISNVC